MKMSTHINNLAEKWRGSGIKEGMMLMLFSDVTRTLWGCRSEAPVSDSLINDIIDSFLLALGESGTLLIPTFNYDFCRGSSFDIRTTPSQVGALTETARKRPDAIRTGHPIFSFVALGSRAGEFADVDNYSAFGKDSPFGMLHKNNGYIALLDATDKNTFFHYVEQQNSEYVSEYRYQKEFSGEYIDAQGNTSVKVYDFMVRKLEPEYMHFFDNIEEALWQAGLFAGDRCAQGCGLRVINSGQMFDVVSDVIQSGNAENMLYRIKGKEYE